MPHPAAVAHEAQAVDADSQVGARLSSAVMFAEIGAQLRERRESLNLRREEIERHTHIGAQYLFALEEGNFADLPSPVQTRGMLGHYATFLDLNVDELLLRFADVLQVRHREWHPLPPGATGKVQPAIPSNLSAWRGFVAADLFGIVVLALLAIFSVWGIERVMQTRSQLAAAQTPPSISDMLLSVTVPPTLPTAATPLFLDLGNVTATALSNLEPTATATFPAGVTVQLNLVALERTYLRVSVDGEVVFDGRVIPGTAYPFEARERIEILAGNGAALRVTFNQRDLGLLGAYAQVIQAIYTANGVFNPTATISPTPTITRTPSLTPSPTKSPYPSLTPTPP
ncbi:MAG: hypothetical protein HFACDABA_01655 [Anaerolineales bacterium]|nr:hypothetical protein [Anaerolineales bacterium]